MVSGFEERRFCLKAWAGLSLGVVPLIAAAQTSGARLMSLRDTSRNRDIPVLLRLPTGQGPWPVVLFSHGLGGARQGSDVWGEAWRSQGIAVIHVQHPGSDVEVLRDGGIDALREAASGEQLVARVRDLRFVIDEIARAPSKQDSPLAQLRIDALGLAGHSFGAWTVQAMAGQRFAAAADLSDSRPKAFLALSPSMPRGDAVSAPFASVTRPFLAVTGSLDGDPLAGTKSGEARASVFDALPPGQRAMLWLDGADHMTFGGQSARRQAALAAAAAAAAVDSPAAAAVTARREAMATEREARHQALIARITATWWKAHLLDDAAAAAQLRTPAGLAAQDRWKN